MMPDTPFPRPRLAIALGIAGSALLLALALWRVLGWQDRAPVEGWMTPRFVMLAHGLSGPDLLAILGPDGMTPGRTLSRIARDQGLDPAALVAEVEAAALLQAGMGK